ncbi:ETS-related transcription factor Elf-3-like isoform X1 [Mya arenaria]|uniref:ETS-related transcription factor Elf-3-like isoform X1 n=2 Tax=Mya arenaria TaxID=6604 RepID=UPI0022E105D5|nr:ETS-related transcription factor Elf-3-like isoform X1 [Mya arenaria]
MFGIDMLMDMESRPFQTMPDTEFSPSSIEHQQDVYMYEDERAIKCEERPDSPTYLDISTSKSSFPNIKSEPDPDTLLSWTTKHPEHWSQNEILDWIYFVASEINVDPATIRGEGFQMITGPELCRMSLEDFKRRDPANGQFFYDMFRDLHKDTHFIRPVDLGESMSAPSPRVAIKPELKCSPCDYTERNKDESEMDNIITSMKGDELEVLLGQSWYPIDPYMTGEIQTIIESCQMPTFRNMSVSSGYGSSTSDIESLSDSEMDTSAFDLLYKNSALPTANPRTGSCSDTFSDDEVPSAVLTKNPTEQTHRNKKPSPRRKQKSGEQGKPQNRGRKPGQISKGNHLWEFIRDLLKDPKCNPHLLRWEEKETGVFRFVQSEAVAQMWGRKKNNPGMTYEKLSRAMRFCRTAGYFAEVPKTGKFPKKLCFRFGTKAYGWDD